MEKCPLCKEEKKTGVTTYSVDFGSGVVVVRKVPAKICTQCGEEWINEKVAKRLENIIENARSTHCQLEVVPFQLSFSN
ncbi:MAG: type II toxin-antitoxin system MqsA family antitoxin [Candidatus Hydrogenedentota bacterium]